MTLGNFFLISFNSLLKYFDNFLNHGEVFLNSLNTFRKIEHGQRGDNAESASQVLNGTFNISQTVDNKHIHIGCLDGRMTETLDASLEFKAFCSTFIEMKNNTLDLSSINIDKLKEFGDYALLINPNIFLPLLEKESLKLGFGFERKRIEYTDLSVQRELNLTPFHKDTYYEGQCEYRYLLWDKEKRDFKSRTIRLGNLKEMCMQISLDNIENLKMRHYV